MISFNLTRPNYRQWHPALTNIVCAFLACLMLSSCGGEGGVGSGGTGITSIASGTHTGTVSGFGSVIIEGTKYNDSSALVSDESDPFNIKTVATSSVKLGMQVRANFSANAAGAAIEKLAITPALIGTVTNVSANLLTIANQTVVIKSSIPTNSFPTVLDGFAGTSGPASGDRIIVFGSADATGAVIATRIELLDNSSTVTRLSGTVTNLLNTGSAQRFTLNGLKIEVNASTLRTSSTAALAQGDRVTVLLMNDPTGQASGSYVAAKALLIEDRNSVVNTGQPWRIGGPIYQLNTASRTFFIGNSLISYASANFSAASAAALQEGTIVRAEGVLTTTPTSAVGAQAALPAADIQIISNSEKIKISLFGTVSNFSSSASFTVRGALVNASSGVTFNNGNVSNLTDGALVELEGTVENGTVKPTKLEFKNSPSNLTQSFIGVVSNYQATSGSFQINRINSQLVQSTVFKGFDGGANMALGFADGVIVKITGAFAQGVFVVSEVRLGNNSVSEVKIEGIASLVNINSRTLLVNGNVVTWTSQTQFNNEENLRNGALVKLEGVTSASGINATKIEVKTR
jgi:Domain of unknown function (DUF5666)